jgi:hypothetical protein
MSTEILYSKPWFKKKFITPEGGKGRMKNPKIFLSVALLFVFTVPAQPAKAAGCAEVIKKMKSVGADINFSNAKSAKKMVEAYELAFKNPKCRPAKEMIEMKKITKDLIVECSKPDTVYKLLFDKPIYDAFCGGFKKLSKYTQ